MDIGQRKKELWQEALTEKPGAEAGRQVTAFVVVAWLSLRTVALIGQILGAVSGELKLGVGSIFGYLGVCGLCWLVWQGAREACIISALWGVIELVEGLMAGYLQLAMLYGKAQVRLFAACFMLSAMVQLVGMLFLFFWRRGQDFFDVRRQVSGRLTRELREAQRENRP